MAKNTSSTTYRKIDVDAFDAEKYEEDEVGGDADTGPDEREVNQLLAASNLNAALKAALKTPPLKSKNQAVKDKATSVVCRVLTAFKPSDIEAAVASLTDDETDLLVKYIYKSMDVLADNATCQSLLNWHSQAINRCGLGAIIRVFTDRGRL